MRNRMVAMDATATTNGTQANYQYNIDGIRTSKTVNGQATHYLIDNTQAYPQVIAETDSLGSRLKTYLYGDDLISQADSNNTTNTFHYDGLGSTRLLSSEAGGQSDTYDYLAFGALQNQTGTTDNNYLYTGEQFDGDLDQYYLRARYYDQGVGRFTQQDAWMGRDGEPVTLNKYLYTHADPVNGVDPSGYMTLMSLTTGRRIQGILASSSTRTFAIHSGKGKGKNVVKQVSCRVGVAYMKNSIAKDAAKAGAFKVEKHHPINKSFLSKNSKNRRPRQSLLSLPSDTHHMFHSILNILLQESGGFDGLNNYSKAEKWQSFFELDPEGREKLYIEIKASAAIVDSLYELKKPESLGYYVEKNKHKFL
ncbi:RHS repeat-associated core domain-containing protein [Pseudoalteromonas spongiae]|uniref:RHS repeat-associated core domain-containing protein n=1 Tax=Pseudoalteromonas spongiae TaxID=298657 RepID=UPI000C2D4301|nr:RHS repeat-associated core domain-containing protein [Pseudoalteromonas spongiae]